MPIRRAAAAPPPPPQSGGSVNFGAPTFFTGGFGLPEGNYAVSWAYQMFQPTSNTGQAYSPWLAVMMTCYPIDPQTGALLAEPFEFPVKCGTNAHASFQPSADGMGLEPVPGGNASGLSESSNWGILWKSLKDAGLPAGVVTNSLEPLNGIWIHTQNIPEPEERAKLKQRSNTGEAAMSGQAQSTRASVCPIVSEILEGGKPWEGTGGIPDETAKPKPGPRAISKPAGAAPVRRAAAPVAPPPPSAEMSDEDVAQAALAGAQAHLAKPGKENGCTKIDLKTGAFQTIKAQFGDEMAQAVMEIYFASDDTLNAVLNQLGYQTAGLLVKLMPQ